jgi:predicted DNA-binding protein (MmcQ/YjbR family)
MGKMFALADVTEFTSVNLKTEPETGVELRETYAAVQPGYHMNKKHWITVSMDGSVPERLLERWIDASYDLVFKGLSKREQLILKGL